MLLLLMQSANLIGIDERKLAGERRKFNKDSLRKIK